MNLITNSHVQCSHVQLGQTTSPDESRAQWRRQSFPRKLQHTVGQMPHRIHMYNWADCGAYEFGCTEGQTEKAPRERRTGRAAGRAVPCSPHLAPRRPAVPLAATMIRCRCHDSRKGLLARADRGSAQQETGRKEKRCWLMRTGCPKGWLPRWAWGWLWGDGGSTERSKLQDLLSSESNIWRLQ